MGRQRDREEFVSIMAQEGIPFRVARQLMSAGATLHRLAELECSSEAADRDRVKCPGDYAPGLCLCRDYGAYDADAITGGQPDPHGDIPRITVKGFRLERRVEGMLKPYPGFAPVFNGDPRGAVLKIRVPSGRSNSLGGDGVCVP